MTAKRLLINAALLTCCIGLLEPTRQCSPLTVSLIIGVTVWYFFDTLKTIRP